MNLKYLLVAIDCTFISVDPRHGFVNTAIKHDGKQWFRFAVGRYGRFQTCSIFQYFNMAGQNKSTQRTLFHSELFPKAIVKLLFLELLNIPWSKGTKRLKVQGGIFNFNLGISLNCIYKSHLRNFLLLFIPKKTLLYGPENVSIFLFSYPEGWKTPRTWQ